jgi:hypothetical protein
MARLRADGLRVEEIANLGLFASNRLTSAPLHGIYELSVKQAQKVARGSERISAGISSP